MPDIRVENVAIRDSYLEVSIRDGRKISVPLAWFPRLARASAAQVQKWEISAAGHGIHWPELDEDLSVAGLLRGERAPA